MLPRKPRRQDSDTLIWEYLDGDLSPSRAMTLSSLLKRRAETRERLVDSAMLHSMLFEHFKAEAESAEQMSRKQRRGKSSAA